MSAESAGVSSEEEEEEEEEEEGDCLLRSGVGRPWEDRTDLYRYRRVRLTLSLLKRWSLH